MTIFQCTSCPKIKSGHPYKSSAIKPWLCDACASKREKKPIPANHTRPILSLKSKPT